MCSMDVSVLGDREEIDWISGEEELYQTFTHKKIILKKIQQSVTFQLNVKTVEFLRKTIRAISEDK